MNIIAKPNNPAATPSEFLNEVLAGMALPQKALSPKWLYDAKGSELFEQITQLPEYYVTRLETKILNDNIKAFAAAVSAGATVVEYGAGAAIKVRLLLDALDEPQEYVAIDISFEHLNNAIQSIAQDYPQLAVRPIEGNFLSGAILEDLDEDGPNIGFFPGSTIGNLTDLEIENFLQNSAKLLGKNGYLVLGADLHKSPEILIPAYDDAAGITAAFNKNLLTRIRRDLNSTIRYEKFRHRAIWNEQESRIEMHLESIFDQSFSIEGHTFSMQAGETIHTENSRKFAVADLKGRVSANGWKIEQWATDSNAHFALILLRTKY